MNFGPFNLNRPGVLSIDNLTVQLNNDIHHLWGQNGVGKSTLMKLILDECLKQKLNFAFVDQNYRSSWLWWLSVKENLSLPLINTGKNLEELDEYRSQMSWLEPLLDKQIGESDNPNLSGGQLQRLVIFRELLLKPKIVLLDEAFSALDIEVVQQQAQWLMSQQATIGFKLVSIAHDRRILDYLSGTVINLSLEPKSKQLQLEYV